MTNPENPLEYLLYDTRGCASTVAKEGIVSLLISVAANYATLTVPGTSFENLLRVLVMFLVVLGIIHYSLMIIDRFRRKRANLEDIQAGNTRKALKNLNNAKTMLEGFIRTSTDVTELRSSRNRLTSLNQQVRNPDLDKFSRKDAKIEEFNAAERALIESSEKLVLELERQSIEGIDARAISGLVDALENAVRSRVPITDGLKDLYVLSMEKERNDRKKVPESVSSDLNLYLNMLLTKYASNKPEVLHTGDYLPGAKWDYQADDGRVTARLSDGFEVPLVLEARWQSCSEAIAELVRKETPGVKRNQYKCLCLVNTSWDDKSRDFTARFSHPRLALYLHELNGRLLYNQEDAAAKQYEFWFNTERKQEPLKDKILKFIQCHESFTAQDLAGMLRMKVEGAEKLLGELERLGSVMDVSLRSDRVRRFAKARAGD